MQFSNCRLSFTFANGTRSHHTFTPQCNRETFALDVQAVLAARERIGQNPAIVKKSMGLPTHRRIVGLTVIIEGLDASHALTGIEYSGRKFVANIPSIVADIFALADANLNGIGEASFEPAKTLPANTELVNELADTLALSSDPVELAEQVIKATTKRSRKVNKGVQVVA